MNPAALPQEAVVDVLAAVMRDFVRRNELGTRHGSAVLHWLLEQWCQNAGRDCGLDVSEIRMAMNLLPADSHELLRARAAGPHPSWNGRPRSGRAR